LLIGII
jgi:phosphatidylinositol 3-kinase